MGSVEPTVAVLPPQVVEPIALIPTYSDGLATVEIIGTKIHFALYVEQAVFGGKPGECEWVINGRVSMPLQAVVEALPWVIRKLADSAVASVAAAARRLVH